MPFTQKSVPTIHFENTIMSGFEIGKMKNHDYNDHDPRYAYLEIKNATPFPDYIESVQVHPDYVFCLLDHTY
jgi:hypothetical protein